MCVWNVLTCNFIKIHFAKYSVLINQICKTELQLEPDDKKWKTNNPPSKKKQFCPVVWIWAGSNYQGRCRSQPFNLSFLYPATVTSLLDRHHGHNAFIAILTTVWRRKGRELVCRDTSGLEAYVDWQRGQSLSFWTYSVCTSVCLSGHLSIHLSFCLFVCLICPSIHLSICSSPLSLCFGLSVAMNNYCV